MHLSELRMNNNLMYNPTTPYNVLNIREEKIIAVYSLSCSLQINVSYKVIHMFKLHIMQLELAIKNEKKSVSHERKNILT